MNQNTVHGAIWFDKDYQSGLMEDFEIYSTYHQDCQLVMSMYTTCQSHLAKIAKTLNNSNIRSIEK